MFATQPVEHHYFTQSTSELRYPKLKGRYNNTPFRVEESLEKRTETTGEKCLEKFKSKGGELVVLDPNNPSIEKFELHPKDTVFPGCTAGLCRSVTLWTVLSPFSESITLFPPHATRQGFDPYNDKPHWQENYEFDLEDDEYAMWNNGPKPVRFAYEEYRHLQHISDPSPELLKELKQFHDDKYYGPSSADQGSRRVYITFSVNTHAILHRLNQTNETLENVIVVSVDLDDYISTPLQEWNALPRSRKAYENLAKLLESLLDTTKL